MAIDPVGITAIRVGQLAEAPINLSDNFPHEVGTDLKRATIQDLVDIISAAVGSGSGVGYLPISVTDGQQLPAVPVDPSFFLCGKGTFLNINGFPDIVCVEELNAIMSLTDHWEIAVEIPITVDPSLNFPKIQFTADGIQNTFNLTTTILAKTVFWNGALLDDADWSQSLNILILTFTPALGEIIKPI